MADVNGKLWPHQNEAIKKASNYINHLPTDQSYLIKLPTGAGKTAIFSVLARVTYPKKNFLILVPSIALKKQTLNQITREFWEHPKIKIDPGKLPPKAIYSFTASEFHTIESKLNQPFIIICVINTLHELRKNYKKDYEFLKKNIDVVVFDEGHREPALSWATAVRGLEKHMLLFTATPFRNDLKLFRVNKDDYYYMTHEEAIKQRIIRG